MKKIAEIYKKDLSSFTQEERHFLFQRYQRIATLFGSQEHIRVPIPLQEYGNTIQFRFEDTNPTIEDLLFQNRFVEEEMWRLVGELLGVLHRSDRTHENQLGVVHGDFATKNMTYRNERLFVFDFEPPPNMTGVFFNTFIVNTIYFDIGRFLFSVLTSHSYKYPFSFWRNHCLYARLFLSSYKTHTHFFLEESLIEESVMSHFREWCLQQKGHYVTRLIKTVVVWTSLLLHKHFYRIYDVI